MKVYRKSRIFWLLKCPRVFDYRLIILILSFLFSFWTFAQILEPQVKFPRFASVSTKTGLAQDTVVDMLLDRDGFLYLGTQGGLDRWDGHQLYRIRGESDQLTDTSITRLFQDSRDNIWIGTVNSGVFRLSPNTGVVTQVFNLPLIDTPEFNQFANNFVEDEYGRILISLDYHVMRYDYASESLEQLYQLPQEMITAGDGIRWMEKTGLSLLIATSDGLFVLEEGTDAVKVNFLPDELEVEIDAHNVKHLLIDKDNRLWISTVKGLLVAPLSSLNMAIASSDHRWPAKTVLPNTNVWRVIQYDENRLWVGSSVGLYSINTNDELASEYILQPMKGLDVLSRKDIFDIEVNRDGNLWLASNYGGALYWSPLSLLFNNIQITAFNTDKQPLTDNNIWVLSVDEQNHLWIGTDNGLTRFNPETNESSLFLQRDDYVPFSEAYIDRIFAISGDTLILQTGEGLWLFDKSTGEKSRLLAADTEASTVLSDFAWGSAIDSSNNIWFAVNNSFYKYSLFDNNLTQLSLPKPFNTGKFYTFLGHTPQYENSMWASMVGALLLIDPNTLEIQTVHELGKNLLTRNLYPSSVLVDNQGTLWVAYPGLGLFGLDSQSFEQKFFFSDENLLPTNLVYSITNDKNDGLWFSSHSGLHRINPARDQIDNFRYGQALNVAEFNDGAVAQLSNGELAFGSPSGVVKFDPALLYGASNTEQTYGAFTIEQQRTAITDISLANRKFKEHPLANYHGQTVSLNHQDNGLSIRFSSLQFDQQDSLSYTYQLSNNGRVITEAETTEPLVTLALLDPGEYEFTVVPTLSNNGFGIQPATIYINVAHAPWNTPQARTMYVFLTLLILLAIWSVRRKQIYYLEQARTQVKLFGDAFKQTSDWVIIFDREFNPMALNPSLERAFGLNSEEKTVDKFNRLKQQYPEFERHAMSGLRQFLREGHWRSEQKLTLAYGKEHDVLINLTTVSNADDSDKEDHYLMVVSDISDQKRAERKLRKMATFDSLTGLVNRDLALNRLEHAIENAKKHNSLVAVLFVDLDRFKGINDSLGHEYGDNILKVVAKRMLNIAAKSDTVGRIGGDEFVIVMKNVTDFEHVSSFIAQLVALIEEPITVRNEILRVSCSIGVSTYPNDGIEPTDLLRFADVAMYSAKNDPVNSFRFFTESMNARAKYRLSLENLVKRAYQQELFYNVYQPIVNAKTARTEGMELLLRCAVSEQPLSPTEFVPILEEMRLIVEVTRASITAAVKEVSRWYKNGFNGYLSVNLSALHFTTHFDLEGLDNELASYQLPKSALRFEVTEGVLMGDRDMALEQFNALKHAGYKLALDDFGTGYSSLSYLKMFPLDVIKIDKSFTDDIGKGGSGDSLIITTIGMANNLHMDCIAEGIETAEQVQFLRAQNCLSLQGYYFSKPVTADMSNALIQRDWSAMVEV